MPTRAALHAFIENLVGGAFTVNPSQVTLGGTSVRVIPNNFERMAVTIVNTGATDCSINITNGVTSTNGILLGKNGGSLSLDAREDLALVGWELWGITAGGSTTVTVLEIVRFAVDTPNLPANASPPT